MLRHSAIPVRARGLAQLVRLVLAGRFFYGWVIVALAFLANFFSSGSGGYSLGLYFQPMHASLGWSRTTLTLGPTLRRVVNAAIAPFVGAAVDRFGARAVMLVGPLLMGAGLAATGLVRTPLQYYVIYGVAGALGTAQLGSLATGPALAKWFVRRRATAIAIAAMGVSFGGIVFIPVTQFLLSRIGWRATWAVTGAAIAVLATVPTFLWMRSQPEDLGLHPDGDVPPEQTADGAPAPLVVVEETWTLREALHTRALWLLVLAFSFGNMPLGSLLLHQVPYMQERHFTAVAAPVASLTAVAALVCKPVWGYCLDRFSLRATGIASYGLSAAGLLLLIGAPNAATLYGYAIVFGFGIGITTIIAPIAWADYFGRRFVGTITGTVQPLQVATNAAAPLFAALVDDRTGSYRPAFLVFVGAYVLAAVFLFFARRPRRAVPISAPAVDA